VHIGHGVGTKLFSVLALLVAGVAVVGWVGLAGLSSADRQVGQRER
jgi:hypothetical protein